MNRLALRERPVPSAAAPVETVLSVPGMRCAGCIAKIEKGLADADGIVSARVNFTARQVAIAHEGRLTLPELVDRMASLGFEAQPLRAIGSKAEAAETASLLKALAVAGFAAMNIMLLSVSVWSGATGETRQMFHWLSALIALPAIGYAGQPFFRSAWAAVRHGRTNMDVPISLGVLLATGLSLFETAIGGEYAYFDGATMLLFFLLAGRVLDSMMRDRARGGIAGLLSRAAPGAMVLEADGRARWLAAADLSPGMLMQIAAGERLAADGVVVQGKSQLDLSHVTGESRPEPVEPGDSLPTGALNLAAPLQVRVTAAGDATSLAAIARLMDAASQSRSRYVRIADRAARLYAPAVHTLALLAFVGWMVAGAGWHQAMLIAVAVLIITCPCALGLAVPAAQVVAAGALMRRGVLVKDGSALERLAGADRVLFDKTGTLTLDALTPTNLEDLDDSDKAVALSLARASRHPVSKAIAEALEASGVQPATLADVQETPGLGVSARHGDQMVSLGRAATTDQAPAHADDAIVTVLQRGDAPARVIRLAERIRPDAEAAIARLAAMGLGASVLSGDRAAAVAPVARALGLTAQCGAGPADKVNAIERLSAAGHRVLMVGDGLNDGPALARAYVSIAPGSASDVGQQAADAVFTSQSLLPVAQAVAAARRTMAVVRQNFALAIGYNALAVPLAVAGYVTPLVAAVAMSGSSLIVVANALRLRSAAR